MTAIKVNENGLKLLQIKSSLVNNIKLNYDGLDYDALQKKIKEFISVPSFCVVYLDYKVLIGRFQDTFSLCLDETYEPKFIQKMRIFNNKEELYFWRSEGVLKARHRKDDEGEECNVIEANQVLFGTTSNHLHPGWTEISEVRGTKLVLPFDKIAVDEMKNRVKIRTRNYIDFNEMGQATYIDTRFVDFTFGENNKSLSEVNHG